MPSNYLREFADFNIASTKEYYLYFSGQKKRYEIAEIYSRYSDLFTLDAIEGLKREHSEWDAHFETARTALSRLIAFASENYLELKVKELTEEITNSEGDSIAEWNGSKIPFHQIGSLLSKEPDANRRRNLYSKRRQIIASLNDLRAERLEKMHELAVKLGFANYLEMHKDLHQVDYFALDADMQRFLSDTDKIYSLKLEKTLARNMGLALSDAERADSYYFARLREYDALFPAQELLKAYRETMEDLGIRAHRQKNIEIDAKLRPNKHDRAFCAPVMIPQEIKLVLKPVGGLQDYEVFFHEAGHAQHFAFTAEDLRPEFKYVGDYALTETYAFLFNYLIGDPLWLEQMLNRRDLGELTESISLLKLYTIRRYAAKLHYEIQLHGGAHSGQASDLYAENLTEAVKFRFDKAEYLSDLDDGLYAANYLRAWLMEVMLREHLMTRYGRKWWKSLRAGNFLKELWNTGNRYTADELASQIGLGKIIVEPLTAEFLMQAKI